MHAVRDLRCGTTDGQPIETDGLARAGPAMHGRRETDH